MSKLTSIGLYLLFLSIILVVCFKTFGQLARRPGLDASAIYYKMEVDTTKPKVQQYHKFLSHQTEIQEYGPAIDTVNMIMGEMGRSMNVDRADALRVLMTKQLQKLLSNPKIDSVLIK